MFSAGAGPDDPTECHERDERATNPSALSTLRRLRRPGRPALPALQRPRPRVAWPRRSRRVMWVAIGTVGGAIGLSFALPIVASWIGIDAEEGGVHGRNADRHARAPAAAAGAHACRGRRLRRSQNLPREAGRRLMGRPPRRRGPRRLATGAPPSPRPTMCGSTARGSPSPGYRPASGALGRCWMAEPSRGRSRGSMRARSRPALVSRPRWPP